MNNLLTSQSKYRPHSYGHSSPAVQLSGSNEYLTLLADPWSASGEARIPDESSSASHTKYLTTIANISGQTHYVVKTTAFQQHDQMILGTPVINSVTGNPGIGWLQSIPMNEDLSENYSRARLISGGTKVTSYTIPSGNFAIQGQIIAASIQGPIDFSNFDIDSLTSYNSPNTLNNRSILEGVVSLAVPNSSISYLPTGLTGKPDNSTGQGYDDVQTFSTPLFPNTSLAQGFKFDPTFSEYSFNSSSPTYGNLLNPSHQGYVTVSGTVHLENTNFPQWGGAVVTPRVSYSVTIRVYYLDSTGNLAFMPGTSNFSVVGRMSSIGTEQGGPLSTGPGVIFLEDSVEFSKTIYCQFPIAHIEVSLKEGEGYAADANTTGGMNSFPVQKTNNPSATTTQDYDWVGVPPPLIGVVKGSYLSVTVTQHDFHNPMKFPTSLQYFSDCDANATLNLTGRWIYECIPNSNLQRQITVRPLHAEELSDFSHALYFMNSHRSLFTIQEYRDFLSGVPSDRMLIATSSFWGDVWKGVKTVGKAVGRPITNFVLGARAPALLGPANAALDNLGFSSPAERRYIGHASFFHRPPGSRQKPVVTVPSIPRQIFLAMWTFRNAQSAYDHDQTDSNLDDLLRAILTLKSKIELTGDFQGKRLLLDEVENSWERDILTHLAVSKERMGRPLKPFEVIPAFKFRPVRENFEGDAHTILQLTGGDNPPASQDSEESYDEVEYPPGSIGHSSSYGTELDIGSDYTSPARNLSSVYTSSYFSFVNLHDLITSLKQNENAPAILPRPFRADNRVANFPIVVKDNTGELVDVAPGFCVLSKFPMGDVMNYGPGKYHGQISENFLQVSQHEIVRKKAMTILQMAGVPDWHITLFANKPTVEGRALEIFGDSWLGALAFAALGVRAVPFVAASVDIAEDGTLTLARVGDIHEKKLLAGKYKKTIFIADSQTDALDEPSAYASILDGTSMTGQAMVRVTSPLEILAYLQSRAGERIASAPISESVRANNEKMRAEQYLSGEETYTLKHPTTREDVSIVLSPAILERDKDHLLAFLSSGTQEQKDKARQLLSNPRAVTKKEAKIFLNFYLNKLTPPKKKEKGAPSEKKKSAMNKILDNYDFD